MASPIGVFDSGLGGLSVVSQVFRLLPDERVVYLADNAHVPYGERPLDDIREFGVAIADFMIERGVKAVVAACNMTSAVALDLIRSRHPSVPVLGVIEPGVEVAVGMSRGDPIGVLATTGTVRSEAYVKAIGRLDPHVRVIQQACPRFVPLVEAGEADSDEAFAAAREYVAPLTEQGCKVIVLGCTHYPFVRSAIASAAGSQVALVDPAVQTVRVLRSVLTSRRLLSQGAEAPHTFYVTGGSEEFAALGSLFLGRAVDNIRCVTWNVHLGRRVEVPADS